MVKVLLLYGHFIRRWFFVTSFEITWLNIIERFIRQLSWLILSIFDWCECFFSELKHSTLNENIDKKHPIKTLIKNVEKNKLFLCAVTIAVICVNYYRRHMRNFQNIHKQNLFYQKCLQMLVRLNSIISKYLEVFDFKSTRSIGNNITSMFNKLVRCQL